jgi:Holliday junction resolvasome RuvABC endonuclease subunit
MKILALDISSKNTGWCVYDGAAIIDRGEVAGDPNKTHPPKLSNYRQVLQAIVAKHTPDLIAIEDAWSGKNKLTFKILSYYHGVTLEICGTNDVPLSIMMPSRFRRIVGAVHNTKLNFADREAAKKATGDLVRHLKLAEELDSEDICDAIAIALAAHIWYTEYEKQYLNSVEQNPKIRSSKRLKDFADKLTEAHFKALEKKNEKSVGNPRS